MTTTRAVLYARYSTDKQRETSIADQLRAARARVEREQWATVATYSDEGVSGSTPVALRAGGKALLADALAGRFEILVLEGLDRLSRELGEAETMVKRLEHRGIRIIGTADGYDTEARGRKVMRIARGLVNELYLDDLREKTHRGLAGQFDRGLSAGGRTYGYRTEPSPDGKGRIQTIDAAEADIVREVFQRFADGHSVRNIVHALNERGVRSARGGTWAVSAVQGSSVHGLGMLNNELYVGRVVWNRRQWLKNPETGKRRYVERPREEWQERDAPELRIIDQALWDAVHARARSGPARGTRVGRGATPRTLFGAGVLRCAACGAAIVGVNRERYGCSAHKERGPAVCPSPFTVRRELLEQRLLTELREDLLAPEALRTLREEVRAVLASVARENDVGNARRRITELDAEIGRLVDAIAAVGLSQALQARLRAAEDERAKLAHQESQGAALRIEVEEIVSRYRQTVLRLQEVLAGGDDLARTRTILADMLGPVVVGRDPETGETYAEMEKPAERLLVAAVGGSLGLVAGAGFEPTTFGL